MFYMLKKWKYVQLIFENISEPAKKITILMTPNEISWHYLTVEKLSALLRRITLKNNGDFYCLNFLHSFKTKN